MHFVGNQEVTYEVIDNLQSLYMFGYKGLGRLLYGFGLGESGEGSGGVLFDSGVD